MSKFKIIPYTPSHLEMMELRPREAALVATPGMVAALSASWTVTVAEVTEDGFIRVAGVIGARILWHGVADVYLIPCVDLSSRNIIAFVRQIRTALRIASTEARIRRFQTLAVDDPLHNRWLSHLGFEKEGTLKEYNVDKEDYATWALRY